MGMKITQQSETKLEVDMSSEHVMLIRATTENKFVEFWIENETGEPICSIKIDKDDFLEFARAVDDTI